MKIIDENGNIILESEVDLEKGYLTTTTIIKENATPVDNITKFAYYDDDYEKVMVYTLKSEPIETPSQLDIFEAQLTYTAMVTGTLLEV